MFVGLDVHKEFCQAAFVDGKGRVIREERFENNVPGRAKMASAVRRSKVVLEASSSAFPVYDALQGVCTIKVAHPLKVKAIASARIKTDKIDARILAQLLRADLIPESYFPSKEQRQVRALVRHRVTLRRMSTRVKNQISSILTMEGIEVPCTDKFGKKGLVFIRSAPVQDTHRMAIDSLLAVLGELNKHIADADQRIEALASENAYAKLLQTHTGVGSLTALAVASEIVDIHRFPSHKHFSSYLGIVPSVYQSGGTDRKGHITKQGNKMLRWLLVQCARSAARHSKRFKKKYNSLRRKGVAENKAIVAIARLIAVDMYFMLVKNEPYKENQKESKGGKPVNWLGHKRPLQRLGSSPLHDLTPCAASTNRSMS